MDILQHLQTNLVGSLKNINKMEHHTAVREYMIQQYQKLDVE